MTIQYHGHALIEANADLDVLAGAVASEPVTRAAAIQTLAAQAVAQWGPTKAVGAFTGRNFTFNGGAALVGATTVMIAGGSIVLADNAVSFVERTYAGVVSGNTTGFTATSIPLAKVTVAAGVITAVEDWRPLHGPFLYYQPAVGEVGMVDLRFPVGDVRRYGAKGDDSTNDALAIQAAVTAVAALHPGTGGPFGGTVVIPASKYRCDAAITLAANVSVVGDGMFKTILKFTNATDGFILEPPAFDTPCGSLRDLQLYGGNSVGTVGIRLLNCGQLVLDRVFSANFGCNLRCRDWDHVSLWNCQFGAYTGAQGAVVFGDSTALGSASSNGIFAYNTWISSANSVAGAGLVIDRVQFCTWLGGTIESCGEGIKLCTTSGADAIYSSSISFIGVDIENCSNYIRVGANWVAGSFGVRGLEVRNCQGTLAGSASTLTGFIFNKVVGLEVRNWYAALTAGFTSHVNITNCKHYQVSANANLTGSQTSYIAVDGVYVTSLAEDSVADPATRFVGAGESKSIVTKTTAYTATQGDYTILADTTASGFTVSLPAGAIPAGSIFVVKLIAGANAVTVQGASGTIDGSATVSWSTLQLAKVFQFDGTNYRILSSS